MMKYFLLTLMLSPCCSQMLNLEMRPDVTFDDRNDRFDISELVAQQNMFIDRARAIQEADYRRKSKDLTKLEAVLRKNVRSNKEVSGFQDRMISEEVLDDEFNRSLKEFQNSRRFRKVLDHLRNKRTRRSDVSPADMERNVLLDYAVPVVMKINGYIRSPFE